MRRRVFVIGLILALVLVVGGVWFLSAFTLSALEDPGRLEIYVATRGKRFLVGGAARDVSPPAGGALNAAVGRMQFVARCASCHGLDGRTPSEVGAGMYPRASNLGSPEVQRWSNAEMFWIIKHGIRLTGMPGFGKTLSDGEIWPLVAYIREIASEQKE